MSSPSHPLEGFQAPISESIPSSSPPMASTTASRKPKKPPPITPKRFTRFFTPRHSSHGSSNSVTLSKSGRQLQDITRSAINRSAHAVRRATPRKAVNFADAMTDQQVETPQVNSRKRKTPYLSPESSPAQSSPSKRSRYVTPPFTILEDELPASEEPASFAGPTPFPSSIRRLKTSGTTSRILQRSFGGILGFGRGFARDHCTSWQDRTANFYSTSNDFHQLPHGAPPFCTASCHSNSMVAAGDEDGWIHFLDADNDSNFTKAHISFRAHSNAIMDAHFSSDDMFLATGSGDQTAQILDTRTQQCVSVLAKHKSSVKQVRFQPGDDKIVATSSRDGAVQIWDLRCKGAHSVHSAWGPEAPYASSVRTLAAAHADSAHSCNGSSGSAVTTKGSRDSTGKSDACSRRSDISVTALSFLPAGRQHLLLTASDASTCVRLWDIRGRYSLRGPALPISTTRHPESHNRHRHFAINSLTLSGDSSRLYALSKDNTIYAYSTSHLVLGAAPELSMQSSAQKYCSVGQEGLGPIYGFRHRNFHAASFYVKASLRPASHDRPELLAVGSTDGCPVLFPTDERLLKRDPRLNHEDDEDDLPQIVPSQASRPSLCRNTSGSRFPSLLADTIPIYELGTPLIRGHDAEVTSVTWAKNGTLVSVGDDYKVRHWKEGRQARELRLDGEAEGRRWQCGWAVVEDGFDDDD